MVTVKPSHEIAPRLMPVRISTAVSGDDELIITASVAAGTRRKERDPTERKFRGVQVAKGVTTIGKLVPAPSARQC